MTKIKKAIDIPPIIGNTVTLFMAVSLALTAILLIFTNKIVSAVSTPSEAAGSLVSVMICIIAFTVIRNREINHLKQS